MTRQSSGISTSNAVDFLVKKMVLYKTAQQTHKTRLHLYGMSKLY